MFWSKWLKYQRPTLPFRLSKSGPLLLTRLRSRTIFNTLSCKTDQWDSTLPSQYSNTNLQSLSFLRFFFYICLVVKSLILLPSKWIKNLEYKILSNPNIYLTLQVISSVNWRSKMTILNRALALQLLNWPFDSQLDCSGKEFYKTSWTFHIRIFNKSMFWYNCIKDTPLLKTIWLFLLDEASKKLSSFKLKLKLIYSNKTLSMSSNC